MRGRLLGRALLAGDEPAELAPPLGQEAAVLGQGLLRRGPLLLKGGQRLGYGPKGAFVLADGGTQALHLLVGALAGAGQALDGAGDGGQLLVAGEDVAFAGRPAGGDGAHGVEEDAIAGDDAAHSPAQDAQGGIEVLHDDGAAQQRVHHSPEALLALHQPAGHAEDATLFHDVEGVDLLQAVQWEDDDAAGLLLGQGFDSGQGVLLTLHHHGLEVLGQRRLDGPIEPLGHANEAAEHSQEAMNGRVGAGRWEGGQVGGGAVAGFVGLMGIGEDVEAGLETFHLQVAAPRTLLDGGQRGLSLEDAALQGVLLGDGGSDGLVQAALLAALGGQGAGGLGHLRDQSPPTLLLLGALVVGAGAAFPDGAQADLGVAEGSAGASGLLLGGRRLALHAGGLLLKTGQFLLNPSQSLTRRLQVLLQGEAAAAFLH